MLQENILKLTIKQKKFYDGLQRLITKNGQSPTIVELVRLMKLSSPRAATQYLEALEQKGLIERRRYERRGIHMIESALGGPMTVNIPVIASAGCDNVNVIAERNFGDFICVAIDLLQGKKKDDVVCVKAVGDSMLDAGIKEGDYVLVEMTEAVTNGDLVVAIIDSFAVIKKLELANNAMILKPVSSDPQYKPIILKKDFRIFGKVIDVIRREPQGELEIVPFYDGPQESCIEYKIV